MPRPSDPSPEPVLSPQELKECVPRAVVAFRGYNVTNLGRSYELLAHAKYGPIVKECLREASRVCGEVIGRRVNLVERVRRRREVTLRTYAESIALIMAMERAQIQALEEFFGVSFHNAKYAMGYSLGEITAVALTGVMDFYDAMRVPLVLAADCAELAPGVTLGVLFSRGRSLPLHTVRKKCLEINQLGAGVIGISACLAPNSLLVMGQGDTLDRLRVALDDLPEKVHLRKNSSLFPPLHTPIVWQRNIPTRAAVLMQRMAGGLTTPDPPILSLVTGNCGYNDYNAREILQNWTDHPQLLWDAVYETLRANVDLVIHAGPEPNIIPATYTRLKDNVEAEIKGKVGMQALSAVVHHPWIKRLLPERTALLRAPKVRQIILEDWLLAQSPA